MNENFSLLTVKEAMWAGMLTQVLEEHGIPFTAVPVHGAGFSLRTGTPEEFRVYVMRQWLPQARELLEGLFPGVEPEEIPEEE